MWAHAALSVSVGDGQEKCSGLISEIYLLEIEVGIVPATGHTQHAGSPWERQTGDEVLSLQLRLQFHEDGLALSCPSPRLLLFREARLHAFVSSPISRVCSKRQALCLTPTSPMHLHTTEGHGVLPPT